MDDFMRSGDSEPLHPSTRRHGDAPVAKRVVRESMDRTLRPDLQSLRGREPVNRSVLTEKIRSVCQHAHDQGLHAEHVIILIKEMWAELLPPTTFDAMHEEHDRLSDVVSLTIAEFYSAPDSSE